LRLLLDREHDDQRLFYGEEDGIGKAARQCATNAG
jgi:hypothetical protein